MEKPKPRLGNFSMEVFFLLKKLLTHKPSDEDEHEFVKEHFNWFLSTFESFPYAVERADAFRYILMWVYGGVYVDMDYECKRPLSEYVPLLRRPVSLVTPKNRGWSNSMIISLPRHELWRY